VNKEGEGLKGCKVILIPKLSEGALEQRVIDKAEKVAINKAVARALTLKPINYETRERRKREKQEGKKKKSYKEGLEKRRLLNQEKQKPLIAFVKEYYQDHYYFNSTKLAKEYGNYHYREVPLGLIQSFSRILGDLRDLGAIEKFNSQQYRKVIKIDKY